MKTESGGRTAFLADKIVRRAAKGVLRCVVLCCREELAKPWLNSKFSLCVTFGSKHKSEKKSSLSPHRRSNASGALFLRVFEVRSQLPKMHVRMQSATQPTGSKAQCNSKFHSHLLLKAGVGSCRTTTLWSPRTWKTRPVLGCMDHNPLNHPPFLSPFSRPPPPTTSSTTRPASRNHHIPW